MSDWIKAVLLGVVEGLTEFIPVSSTGHLILFGEWLEFYRESAASFEIFIQLGAILAVVVLYVDRFRGLVDFSEESNSGFRGKQGLLKLFVACLPAFIFGALAHDYIKLYLFSPLTVAIALIVGGVALIGVEGLHRSPKVFKVEEVTYRTSFLIGIFQCLALWPGISRSGATIVGGMLLGLERKIAAEFSFLVAVPVMCAAVGYDFLKSVDVFTLNDLWLLAIGFIVSFITAIFAIRFFLAILTRYTLSPFGYYRVLLGAFVIVMLS